MEVGLGPSTTVSDSAARRLAGRTTGGGRPAALASSTSSSTSHSGRQPSSPTPAAGSPSPTDGQSQHEVLQKFFKSLLSKERPNAGAGAGAAGAAPAAGSQAPKTNGDTSVVEEGGS